MANRDKPDDNCHNASLSVYPIGSLFFAAIGDDERKFVISDYLTDKSKQPVEKSSCCDLFCDMPFQKRLLCCNNDLS